MKMDKETKAFVVIMSCIVVVGFVGVILAGLYDAKYWEKTYRLDEQYIGSVQCGPDGGYDCINGLVLDVHSEWWNLGGLQTENYTFCARESELRDDLQPGDLIEVRWERIGGKSFVHSVRRVECE